MRFSRANKLGALATACGLVLLTFFLSSCQSAAPREVPLADLASPSQKTRDAAAHYMQKHFDEYARTNLASIMTNLEDWMPESNVMKVVKAHPTRPLGAEAIFAVSVGSGGTKNAGYPELDGMWDLSATYNERAADFVPGAAHLINFSVTTNLGPVMVMPPTNYSGRWTLYYKNGSRASVTRYKNGRKDGSDTAYYSSGRISNQGVYREDKQVGTWTWYNPDGSVSSSTNLDSGR